MLTTFYLQEEMGETEYLLSSPANKKKLLHAVEYYKSGVNFLTVNGVEELKKLL